MNVLPWHPWSGCSHHSPGCLNCYAMDGAPTALVRRGVWNGKLQWNEAQIDLPLRTERPSVFSVCPHGDLFHENAPDEWLDSVFAVMSGAQQHSFNVLTKRAARMREYVWRAHRESNIAFGVSIERQREADERLPELLAIRGVKYVTAFPLLGPIELKSFAGIDSVHHLSIGEDPLRPAKPEWVAGLAADCAALGIPVSGHNLADAVKLRGF